MPTRRPGDLTRDHEQWLLERDDDYPVYFAQFVERTMRDVGLLRNSVAYLVERLKDAEVARATQADVVGQILAMMAESLNLEARERLQDRLGHVRHADSFGGDLRARTEGHEREILAGFIQECREMS